MSSRAIFAGIGVVTCLAGTTAWAQTSSGGSAHIFTCRDSSGRVITSDHPPSDCTNSAIDERSQGGLLIREIPAPLTPEQQRQKAIDDRKRHDEEFQAQEQRRKDRALLATYSNDDEIESARTRALADYQEALKVANENLAALLQERDQNNKDAVPYRGKPLPLDLQHRIDNNEAAINGVTHSIGDNRTAIDRINQRFDADLDRFRYLEKLAAH